ncbi:MAG TPA: carboxymuconolactone decarboxylase family protein [Acidimicrobiales bacterium]|nr:carboxymuconolactone decarboxylase family protein [Acidimicrobiales bacterium]
MGDAHKVAEQSAASGRKLRSRIPEVYSAYSVLHRSAMGEGNLAPKYKELIALAIAATRECDGCIASHARAAVRQGATIEEVSEAMGVVILMNGGPGTVWGPRALEAFEEYSVSSTIPTAEGQANPATTPT